MSQRALIVKFGAIGDVIMALPAARALHDAGIQIDWVDGGAVRSLLECYSLIRVLPVNDQVFLRGTVSEKVVSGEAASRRPAMDVSARAAVSVVWSGANSDVHY